MEIRRKFKFMQRHGSSLTVPFLQQFQTQLLYDFIHATDLSCLRVLIDDRLVFDLFGPIGIPQRVDRLFDIVIGRTDTGYHQCHRIAAQRVLQQASEFRVSVADVRTFVGCRKIGKLENFSLTIEKIVGDRTTYLLPVPISHYRERTALGLF